MPPEINDIADQIGQAAFAAPMPSELEYVLSDNVNQMVLLYAILLELRKISAELCP